MSEKENLIRQILGLELDMFLSVPTDRQYSCQQDPEGFRLHRGVQFSIWSVDTLESYLEDLRQAKAKGRNLMTVKYARMEKLIPQENFNPLIQEIVDLHVRWQKEMVEKYPRLMAGGRKLSASADSTLDTSFETYLRGELETYSDNTLRLLHRDLLEYDREGVNGAEMVYELLTKKVGYKSIEAAEEAKRI